MSQVQKSESLAELLNGKRIRNMRTDWLLMEKERLEREQSADPNYQPCRDLDISVIESELKSRSPHEECPDLANEHEFDKSWQ
jgi:hypothetical protein